MIEGRSYYSPKPVSKEAVKRRERGETLAEIGRSYNVRPATISRLVA